MIRIRRTHYTAPAFPKQVVFWRMDRKLRVRLRYLGSRAGIDRYELELRPKGGTMVARCVVLEDKGGKWALDDREPCPPMPPAVAYDVGRFLLELDAAVRREGNELAAQKQLEMWQ